MKDNLEKIIVIQGVRKEITIRALRKDECGYPSHKPVRIVIDQTVHLVQKHNAYVQTLALCFEPEVKWKKCPNCNKTKWSAWMPTSIGVRRVEIVGGEKYERVSPELKWYIVCIHCTKIVTMTTLEPYIWEAWDYVYDPADDVEFVFLPEKVEKCNNRPRQKASTF